MGLIVGHLECGNTANENTGYFVTSRSTLSLPGQRQSSSQCKQSVVLSYDMDAMVVPYCPL